MFIKNYQKVFIKTNAEKFHDVLGFVGPRNLVDCKPDPAPDPPSKGKLSHKNQPEPLKPVNVNIDPALPTPTGPQVTKRTGDLTDSRRTSMASLLDLRPRHLRRAFDLNKKKDSERSQSNSSRNSRSQSMDLDYSDFDEKTFSVTILVNENEKNKIVDMIQKAKTLISKKVEKVIGKKPKSAVSNVEALQTVLESWVDREERKQQEEEAEEEKLVQDQDAQVMAMVGRGEQAPVTFKPVPKVSVSEHEESDIEEECSIFSDMEVSRLDKGRYLQSPTWRRPLSPPSRSSLTPTLSHAENVPCPWGNRSDAALYPPRLRRPSSLYGTEAAAASSRPPSRQVSVSPSLYDGSTIGEESVPSSTTETIKLETLHATEETDETENEEEEELYEDPVIKYARPDSFVIPIGGVWKPDEEGAEPEPAWGKVEEDKGSADKGFNDRVQSYQTQPLI